MAEMKEMVTIVDNTKPRKTPEEKQYLICITSENGDAYWDIVYGRTEAYDTIKHFYDLSDINFDRSFILVESCTLNQRKSIYAFMKYCENFYEDNFDIDDYIRGDWSEEEYRKNNDINNDLIVNNSDKIDMTSFMNGEVAVSPIE
jgi:hypothetical protein